MAYQPTYMDILAVQDMNPEQREEYFAGKERQQNIQSGVLGAASLFDIIQGGRNRKDAEADIEEGARLRQDVVDKIQDIKYRDFAGLTPEARRNAAILLKDYQPDDSDELAAAEMALRSGAAPTSVQRALNEALTREESMEQGREEAAFREGMGYARQDEQVAIQKLMSDYGLDYQMAQEMIAMGQQQSMMGQQQSGAGWRNLFNAAVRYMGSGGGDKLKELFNRGGDETGDPLSDASGTTALFATNPDGTTRLLGGRGGTSENQALDFGQMGDLIPQYQQNLDEILFNFEEGDTMDLLGTLSNYGDMSLEAGGVMKTPGEFSHESNPIDVMRGGAKIAEMTGGEFVINPDQAAGMETAYAKAKKNKSKANLLELFNAVRFIDEPQFD
tara:strand:+ start:14941 stop:16104 length:1164 start_codon:yes stop_codon:yes gene_type:complete